MHPVAVPILLYCDGKLVSAAVVIFYSVSFNSTLLTQMFLYEPLPAGGAGQAPGGSSDFTLSRW